MEMIENGALVGSINGTVVGNVALVTGKKGLALYTNGVDQFVDFSYQGDTCLGYFLLCTHGWVAVFWAHRGNDTRGRVMDTGSGVNKGVDIYWRYPYEMRVTFRSNSKKWFLRKRTSSKHGWIHIVTTWCSNYARLYFNGVRVAKVSSELIPPVSGTRRPSFVVGADYRYRSGFKGSLDELRVWDTVMSDGDVLKLYRQDSGRID